MYNDKRVGLGITTYERPTYFRDAALSAYQFLNSVVDYFYVYDDGSKKYKEVYSYMFFELPEGFNWPRPTVNMGVCFAKNNCLQAMIDADCDYLFLMEDDMIVTDTKAVTGYIDACEASGIQHLSYAHHGAINKESGPYGPEHLTQQEQHPLIEVYSACVGSWSFYTRDCIEVVGLMDPVLNKNTMEHVEHTLRCAEQGFTTRFWRFADAKGSENWLRPQRDSLDTSTIRNNNPNWMKDYEEALEYIKAKHPGVWT